MKPSTAEVDDPIAASLRLTPADRLRLAATLLEEKRPLAAHQIAETVVMELGAAMISGFKWRGMGYLTGRIGGFVGGIQILRGKIMVHLFPGKT